MTEEYIRPIPIQTQFISTVDVKENEQNTPKRITINYQPTAIFHDFSEENKEQSLENSAR